MYNIYYLTDESGSPKYVGKTTKPLKERLHQHSYSSKEKEKYNWILSNKVKIVLIEVCDYNSSVREKFWIREYKKIGYKLFNKTKGGENGFCFNHSEETKLKMSKSKLGHKISNETKLKISESNLGRIIKKSTRMKISKTLKGNIPVNKGKKMSEEQKLKISKTLKGRNTKEEHKNNKLK